VCKQASSTARREESGDHLDDMVSAPKQMIADYLSKHFPLASDKLADREIDFLIHQVLPGMYVTPPSADQSLLHILGIRSGVMNRLEAF